VSESALAADDQLVLHCDMLVTVLTLVHLIVKMYRLNSISHMSRCVLPNINFIRSGMNIRRNVHVYKNVFVKLPRFIARIEKYRFNDSHKSQENKSRMLLAVSLPTLIFNYFLGIEDTDEEVPEVIMTIKRSVLLIQVRYVYILRLSYVFNI